MSYHVCMDVVNFFDCCKLENNEAIVDYNCIKCKVYAQQYYLLTVRFRNIFSFGSNPSAAALLCVSYEIYLKMLL